MIRVQRKRTRGWRMPENTVYVGRGSKYGNPFVIGRDGDALQVIRKYAQYLFPYSHHAPDNGLHEFFVSEANLQEVYSDLKGKNLACWCALDAPCHADLLLQWANDGQDQL